MKRKIQDKAAMKNPAKHLDLIWKLTALFIPVIVVASMLVSVHFIHQKMIGKPQQAGSAYEARDFALFVAMPLLNAALK